jgi:6,7-dimethyl-8-ribityllumazine synthase
MSGGGAPEAAPVDGSALRVAVVAGQWHEQVADGLLSGALRGLTECKVVAPRVVRAPGAFEVPVLAKALAEAGYDAVVCLGVVIRGGTPHFDSVAGEAARGIADAARDTGVPVIFGVLTTDSLEQARDRAGGKHGNKGWDAAMAAIEMASLLGSLPKAGGEPR